MLRRLLPLLLLAAALCAQRLPAPVPAKPQARPAQLDKATEKELARWLERANYWTDAALEEEWQLDPGERPILYSRLGQLWSAIDPPRARRYLEQAFAAIEHPAKNESLDEAKMRLQAANALSGYDSGTDSRYRKRGIRVVEQILDEYPDDPQVREFAMSSLEGGLADMVQMDMPGAVEIARTMLQHDSGNHFQGAWLNIAGTDPAQGNALYKEALQRAAQSHDDELIFGLGEIAFPRAELQRPDGWPKLPDQLKQAYLDLLYRELTRMGDDEGSSQAVCNLFGGGARLMNQFPPAQMGTLQPIAERCQAQNRYVKSEIQAAQKQLSTIDDYLRAAASEPDPDTRIELKFHAARLAHAHHDFARAFDILDAFTTEEKDRAKQWPFEWLNIAQSYLRDLLKAGDSAAIDALLQRAPDAVKPRLYVTAITGLRRKDEGLARNYYMQYRGMLEHTHFDRPDAYTGVIGVCLLLAPSEMPQVLQLAVDGINQIPPADPRKTAVAVLGYQFGPIGIPSGQGVEIGDQEDQMMRAAIDELKSPHNRTAFRVTMVRSIIIRYGEEHTKALAGRPVPAAK